jgi:hypothetical protein
MKISEQLALVEQAEIQRRLKGYQTEDATEQRNALVAEWRKHHPEAAHETSSWLKPLILLEGWRPSRPSEPQAYWHNDVYTVSVRRHEKDPVFGTNRGMIQLGISSLDGSARHDWRDFQAIKNQLAGPECEAFELYPAESRLLDPSNYYTLWCFPGLKRLKVGREERHVLDADVALAPQRGLAREKVTEG